MAQTLVERRVRTARRELIRALGDECRRLREDAGRSQSAIAAAAGIDRSHLSRIEAGLVEPSVSAMLAIAAALGADLSVRVFPQSGPRIRDRIQLAISEALLAARHPRWHAMPEVPVYRPVRGVIDVVLEDRAARCTLASEIHSQLRRVEQQIRWSVQKADALAAAPEQVGNRVSRLLVVRNTAAMREVVRAGALTIATAYPARTADAVASLTGVDPWPGPSLVWATVERGSARLLDGPPRGITVGR